MTDRRISGASSNPRSEVDIRVNPSDVLRIVAAANDVGASSQAQFFSTDAGLTWQERSLPTVPGDGFQSDPAVDWTGDGTAWTMTIGLAAGAATQLRCFSSPPNRLWDDVDLRLHRPHGPERCGSRGLSAW